MNAARHSGQAWAVWISSVLLLLVVGRFAWLALAGKLEFESEISALLPGAEESRLAQQVEDRVSRDLRNRIAIIVQASDAPAADAATDRLAELIDQEMAEGRMAAEWAGDTEFDSMPARILAMSGHKDRLLADRSRQRMRQSADAQLAWRSDRVAAFPPSYITDPVADPLGTLEEFLAERLPGMRGIVYDGLYLRVDGDVAANLLLLNLDDGDLGNEQAGISVRLLGKAVGEVERALGADIHLSGFQIHSVSIKERAIEEVRWMIALMTALTLAVFLFFTRSGSALLISSAAIAVAMACGVVVSQGLSGLPHLIGLALATTAIGICIDASFHFWIQVRSGKSGAAAIDAIRPGINLCFLTTGIGLAMVAFSSIPVLLRTAVFVLGALAASWMMAMFIVPRLARRRDSARPARIPVTAVPRPVALGAAVVIALASVAGLALRYHTDDSPIKLGRPVPALMESDQLVRQMTGIDGEPVFYVIEGDSAEAMLEAEASLLGHLSQDELAGLRATSRLVVPEAGQEDNRLLFESARAGISAEALKSYVSVLGVSRLDWSGAAEPYTLEWVLSQPWAIAERRLVLECDGAGCASMLRAHGRIAEKLAAPCRGDPRCGRISLSERRTTAFASLRAGLGWAMLLALAAIFLALFVRYRARALRLMAAPALATLSGVAAVAWAGMPITAFTLASTFLLIGLSVDYVVFAAESRRGGQATFVAIFASALTTSLSFAVLSLSATPAVQFFAIPVAVGIPVAWIAVHAFAIDYV